MDLDKLLKIAEKATQGKREVRTDTDYYMGGTYIGVGPKKYVEDPENRYGGQKLIPCDSSEVEYFDEDICLIVSNNDADIEFFETFTPDLVKSLIEEIKNKPII